MTHWSQRHKEYMQGWDIVGQGQQGYGKTYSVFCFVM